MIRKADNNDAQIIAELAVQLWYSHSINELEDEFTELLNSNEAVIYLEIDNNKAVGFAQCQLRHDYVEGTHSSPVGYLEGIFVLEEYRNKGYAKELLSSCEKWAAEHGCSEFASDCELNNLASLQFHLNCGFTEANRIICFKKRL